MIDKYIEQLISPHYLRREKADMSEFFCLVYKIYETEEASFKFMKNVIIPIPQKSISTDTNSLVIYACKILI